MKKRLLLLLSLSICTGMLCACTDNAGGSRGTYEPEEEEPVVTQAPTPSPEPDMPSPEPVEELALFGSEFSSAEVEGNGGYFIRLGRNVYYRVIAEEAMPQSALFAEYLNYEDASVPSTIAVYDLDANEFHDVMQVNAYGKMYACTEGLLSADGNGNIMLYDPQAVTSRNYCGGDTIIDVSDDGKLVAVAEHDDNWNISYSVYNEGDKLYTIDGMTDVYGFAGDELVTMRIVEETNAYELLSYSLSGDETLMGTFIKPAELYDAWTIPELIEFEPVEDELYITFGYYEGTGHFLSAWEAYCMQAGVEGSLKDVIVTNENNMMKEPGEPKMFFDPDGEIYFYDVKKGTLGLSDGYSGDLVYYDSPFSAQVIDRYTVNDYQDTEWLNDVPVAVVLDKTAFYITTTGNHIREDDIGWRYAYAPMDYCYYAIPFGEDAERNSSGEPVDRYQMFMGFPKHVKDEDVAKLAGTDWDFYSYEVEGEFGLAEEDVYERHMHFNDDGTIQLSLTYIPENRKMEYTLEPEELDYYTGYPCYALDDKSTGHEDWVITKLIGDHLEFSVEWKYTDGTPGGCTYVFNPAE